MDWSPQQSATLDEAFDWWRRRRHQQQVFRVFGFAGTGKSTLALEIGSWARSPVYACFTGKAASVLRERGEVPATTLHSLLYASVYDRETDTFRHTRRPRDPGIDLLVIDEASMVDQRLGADVVALRVPTLVLADPFQLPPISGTGFFMRVRPDARLSEIHRQAQGHPIISFADRIRRGEFAGVRGRLRPRDSSPDEKVRIVKVHAWPSDFDTVLCGANATRLMLNDGIRRDRGFSGLVPREGETVMCLANNLFVEGAPVFNGMTWTVLDSVRHDRVVKLKLRAVQSADQRTVVRVPVTCFSREPPPQQWTYRQGLQDFTYGYALTTHKAQGSEWDNVLLIDEQRNFPDYSQRWLYTAVTRARNSITIVVR